MKPPSTNRPTQGQLVFPLMETIKEMGGRGKSADVSVRLAEKFELPDDVVQTRVEQADGQTLGIWNRHVRFARQKAKSMGYVASGGTGLWDLADEGAFISKDEHDRFFTPIWSDVPGARTNGGHPAPFPVEIPYRLARMFSFPGNVVLDLFGGSGTTAVACAKAGRNSVIVDVSPEYVAYATRRLHDAERKLGHAA